LSQIVTQILGQNIPLLHANGCCMGFWVDLLTSCDKILGIDD